MRAGDEGGIAEQRHAPEGQTRRLQVVDRLEQRRGGDAHDLGKERAEQLVGVATHGGDDLWPELWAQRHDLFAYGISFAVIGRFWFVHHRFFGDVTGFDSRLISLNLFYLAWIVLIPFSSQVLGDHGGEEPAVVLYAVNLIGVILAGTLLFLDARRAGLSRPSSVQDEAAGRRSALMVAAIFAISIAIAFLISPEAATYSWLLLFFIPVAGRVSRRQH